MMARVWVDPGVQAKLRGRYAGCPSMVAVTAGMLLDIVVMLARVKLPM